MTITKEQLAEWKALAESATAGPWDIGRLGFVEPLIPREDMRSYGLDPDRITDPWVCSLCVYRPDWPLLKSGSDPVTGVKPGTSWHVHWEYSRGGMNEFQEPWRTISSRSTGETIVDHFGYEDGGVDSCEADAQFIVAARMALPALIAEVERLQGLETEVSDLQEKLRRLVPRRAEKAD